LPLNILALLKEAKLKWTIFTGPLLLLNRLLLKSLFTGSKTFFPDLSGFAPAYAAGLVKNGLMTAQKDFRLGNSLQRAHGFRFL
jgi:hypothetical protein